MDSWACIQVNLWVQKLESGDQLLLCSDGLWSTLEDSEIGDYLSQPDTSEGIVIKLIEAANEKSGHDNIAVALCEMEYLAEEAVHKPKKDSLS